MGWLSKPKKDEELVVPGFTMSDYDPLVPPPPDYSNVPPDEDILAKVREDLQHLTKPKLPDTYEGRLTSLEGNLYAYQRTWVGERTIKVHDEFGDEVIDEDGDPIVYVQQLYETGPFHNLEVKWKDGVGYVFVDREAGDSGHFEDHHKRFTAPIRATASEEDGPHHFSPVSDDPNILPDGTLLADADHIAEKITGHTDAYLGIHHE